MRNAKCSICGHVRPGEEALRHCPSCGARAIFAIATSEALSPQAPAHGRQHGALFFPGRGACLNFD
jgi:hypothetical protein